MEGGANGMMKECVVLNGQVINIGPWDYQIRSVEVSPAEYDEEGNMIKEPVYEDQITNPLPEGAEIVELDVEYSDEHGWRVVGSPIPETPAEKLARLEQENADLRQAVAELTMLVSMNAGSGSE